MKTKEKIEEGEGRSVSSLAEEKNSRLQSGPKLPSQAQPEVGGWGIHRHFEVDTK